MTLIRVICIAALVLGTASSASAQGAAGKPPVVSPSAIKTMGEQKAKSKRTGIERARFKAGQTKSQKASTSKSSAPTSVREIKPATTR
ncbi:MAG TPA: hypothetical protein VF042_14360 [Gemmatimonadaceae bacterium]